MKKVIIISLSFIAIIILYGFFINPSSLKVKEYSIYSNNLADSFDGYVIAQFSDTLIRQKKDLTKLEKVISKINNANADIIVFTGDLINASYPITDEEITELKKLLNSISCKEIEKCKFAVLGDNDNKNLSLYKEIMGESGFTILDNDSKYLFYENKRPILIASLNEGTSLTNVLLNEEGINPCLRIVLTHQPDNVLSIKEADNIDLILAGHSLGGKIRLPFLGGIIKKNGSKTYLDEYYEINNSKLYISNGIGNEGINFRMLNSPSINIYRLWQNEKN